MTQAIPSRQYDRLLYYKWVEGKPARTAIVPATSVAAGAASLAVPRLRMSFSLPPQVYENFRPEPGVILRGAFGLVRTGGHWAIEIPEPAFALNPDRFIRTRSNDWQSLCVGPGLPIQFLNRRAALFPSDLLEAQDWPSDQLWRQTVEIRAGDDSVVTTGFARGLWDETYVQDGVVVDPEPEVLDPATLLQYQSGLLFFTGFFNPAEAPWDSSDAARGIALQRQQIATLIEEKGGLLPWTISTLSSTRGGGAEGDFELRRRYAHRDDLDFEGVKLDQAGNPVVARITQFVVRKHPDWRAGMLLSETNVWDGSDEIWLVQSVVELDRQRQRLICQTFARPSAGGGPNIDPQTGQPRPSVQGPDDQTGIPTVETGPGDLPAAPEFACGVSDGMFIPSSPGFAITASWYDRLARFDFTPEMPRVGPDSWLEARLRLEIDDADARTRVYTGWISKRVEAVRIWPGRTLYSRPLRNEEDRGFRIEATTVGGRTAPVNAIPIEIGSNRITYILSDLVDVSEGEELANASLRRVVICLTRSALDDNPFLSAFGLTATNVAFQPYFFPPSDGENLIQLGQTAAGSLFQLGYSKWMEDYYYTPGQGPPLAGRDITLTDTTIAHMDQATPAWQLEKATTQVVKATMTVLEKNGRDPAGGQSVKIQSGTPVDLTPGRIHRFDVETKAEDGITEYRYSAHLWNNFASTDRPLKIEVVSGRDVFDLFGGQNWEDFSYAELNALFDINRAGVSYSPNGDFVFRGPRRAPIASPVPGASQTDLGILTREPLGFVRAEGGFGPINPERPAGLDASNPLAYIYPLLPLTTLDETDYWNAVRSCFDYDVGQGRFFEEVKQVANPNDNTKRIYMYRGKYLQPYFHLYQLAAYGTQTIADRAGVYYYETRSSREGQTSSYLAGTARAPGRTRFESAQEQAEITESDFLDAGGTAEGGQEFEFVYPRGSRDRRRIFLAVPVSGGLVTSATNRNRWTQNSPPEELSSSSAFSSHQGFGLEQVFQRNRAAGLQITIGGVVCYLYVYQTANADRIRLTINQGG